MIGIGALVLRCTVSLHLSLSEYSAKVPADVGLSHPSFPLLLQLQFTRAEARIEGKEIGEQAVETGSSIHHGKVTGVFEIDLVHVKPEGFGAIHFRNVDGRVILPIDEQAGQPSVRNRLNRLSDWKLFMDAVTARGSDLLASESAFKDSGEWSESQSTSSLAALAALRREWIELKSSGQSTAMMRSTLARLLGREIKPTKRAEAVSDNGDLADAQLIQKSTQECSLFVERIIQGIMRGIAIAIQVKGIGAKRGGCHLHGRHPVTP